MKTSETCTSIYVVYNIIRMCYIYLHFYISISVKY